MLVQVMLGIVIAMVLGLALRLNSTAFTMLKSVGVVLGLLMFQNAVHLWPRHFAALTSEPWVTQIISQTKPFSILWRGISFAM